MWETELAIRHNGCPVSDVSSAHPAVRFENVRRVGSANGRAKRLLCFEGERAAVDAFVEDFRAHPATESLERVSSDDGSRASYYISEVEYSDENPSIRYLIEQAGCFRHPTVVVRGGIEHWTIYTRSKEAVREFLDSVERVDNNVAVVRNVDIGPITDQAAIQHAPLRSELTDGQVRAFRAALELGYYREDERVTIADIADRLNVHRSTAGEHVKRAENTLLSEIGARLFPGEAGEGRETLAEPPELPSP
jgi:predicted DNA binding protein